MICSWRSSILVDINKMSLNLDKTFNLSKLFAFLKVIDHHFI